MKARLSSPAVTREMATPRKQRGGSIVLFGSAFWSRAVDFGFLVAEGMIDPADVDLFTVVDTAEEAIAVLENFYGGKPPP